MRRLALALALIFVSTGCFGAAQKAETPVEEPELAPALAFGAPVDIDAGAFASEPDLVALDDGTVLACAVDRRSGERPFAWARVPGGDFERLRMPEAGGTIDCVWGKDAGGAAYLATSTGPSVVVAVTRDAANTERESTIASPGATYDRPWIAGGEADQALVIAYNARAGIEAWHTGDAGATWMGPVAPLPGDVLAFQAFGNLVWRGGASYAFPYAPLSAQAPAVESREIRVALTDDGGATWRHAEVAAAREGNVLNMFPWIAADELGGVAVAWAEAPPGGAGTRVWLARSAEGEKWAAPVAVTGDGETALMPRVVATPGVLHVVSYRAQGVVAPNFEEAVWDVAHHELREGAWNATVVAAGVHEGTIATGGYGRFVAEFIEHPGDVGSANSQEMLHHLGATALPGGGIAIAWTDDASGATRVKYAQR